MKAKGLFVVFLGLMAVLLLAAGCTNLKPVEDKVSTLENKVTTLEGKSGKLAATAAERTFYVSAIEIKGSTTTTSLAEPTVDPTTLSDGYRYKAPGVFDAANPTKWEVSSYIWSSGSMTVNNGDTVHLVVFVVNGDEHETWVEAPDGTEVLAVQELNRGREYTLSFTANQVGVYKLHCDTHDPTMTGYIGVLPTQ